jgi:hypothetical protein
MDLAKESGNKPGAVRENVIGETTERGASDIMQ